MGRTGKGSAAGPDGGNKGRQGNNNNNNNICCCRAAEPEGDWEAVRQIMGGVIRKPAAASTWDGWEARGRVRNIAEAIGGLQTTGPDPDLALSLAKQKARGISAAHVGP